MPTNSDTPKVHLSFSKFEDTESEDFVYMTKANKRVTFVDPFGDSMDPDEGEKLMTDASNGRLSTGHILEKWLSKTDREAFLADKLNLRRRAQVIEAVLEHYNKRYGTEGEGSASES